MGWKGERKVREGEILEKAGVDFVLSETER